MQIIKKKLEEALSKALQDKGKRKFKQSVEMIINFRAIDFTKPENRLNVDVVLPAGRGKRNKVAVIGSDAIASEAKKVADKFIHVNEVPNIPAKDVKKLAKEYFFLAEPRAIGIVAKHWGKVLGPRGKIPKPLVGELKKAVESVRDLVRIQTKGKYLPTVQALIGTEEMSVDKLLENAEAVLNEIKKKIPEGNIKSIYFKLTMGKPVKV